MRNVGDAADVGPIVRVDIWSDIVCPWCFIGKREFEAGMAAFAHADQVDVRWHSYQLDPSLPERYAGTEVDYLVAHKGMSRGQVQQMIGVVAGRAASVGLAYDFDNLVVAGSLPGHHLIHLADRYGLAGQAEEALFSAHFEGGLDIGDPTVLAEIGAGLGLTEAQVRDSLTDGAVRAAIEADFAQAGAYGIRAVPFFVLDGRLGVSGAQAAATFSAALEQAWAGGGAPSAVDEPNAHLP